MRNQQQLRVGEEAGLDVKRKSRQRERATEALARHVEDGRALQEGAGCQPDSSPGDRASGPGPRTLASSLGPYHEPSMRRPQGKKELEAEWGSVRVST